MDQCSEALNEVIEDDRNSVEEVSQKLEKIQNKLKFRCFGKVTLAANKDRKEAVRDSTKSEEEKAKMLLETQIKEVDKEIEEIKMAKKGTVGRVYEVARRVRQGKDTAMQPTAVMNPATGRLAVT